MSILKKLFGTQPSQKTLIPRPPRIQVKALHRVVFRRLRAGGNDAVSVGNISTFGMGLLRPQARDAEVGTRVEGELEINQNGFRIEGEVRHLTEAILGCRFLGDFKAVSRAIEEYFRVEICALNLNRVDDAYLKQDPAGRVSWFTDGRQNEVYLLFDQDGVVEFHLSFLGNYIEGGRVKPLRCGHILEDAPEEQNKHKGSSLLHLDESVSSEILALGRLLVENVEKMPSDQARALIALLSQERFNPDK